MEATVYEVTLMLETDINDAQNPTFTFFTFEHMMQQVEVFITQGYTASVKCSEDCK